MKKQLLFTLVLTFSLFLSSCEKENIRSVEKDSMKSIESHPELKTNSSNSQKGCSQNFELRTLYNVTCHDNANVSPTADFEIVFENPTTESIEFIFSIKKDKTKPQSLLVPGVTNVFIPAGTTIKTVTSSCGLPSLIECNYNGTASQNFYIEFVEARRSSGCDYSTNDELTIKAYRVCFGDETDPPIGGGFKG